jgi:hypothetical protein
MKYYFTIIKINVVVFQNNVYTDGNKAELKENLIPRQKYYQNTSPNIDKEINYIIIKLN